MSIQRLLALFAAAMIVCAVTLGTLDPRPMTLGRLFMRIDPAILDTMAKSITACCGDGIWTTLLVPVLMRPAWLLPAALALIAIGLAVSVSTYQSSRRSRRRS